MERLIFLSVLCWRLWWGYNSVISKVIFNKSWLLTLIMLYYYFLLIKMSIIITPVLFFLLLTCQKLSIKISIIDFMILLIIFSPIFFGVILHKLIGSSRVPFVVNHVIFVTVLSCVVNYNFFFWNLFRF